MANRDFILGDTFDPAFEEVQQNGAVNYTASVKVYFFDPVTEQEVNTTKQITVGTSFNLDIASGYQVTLTATPNKGYEFTSVTNENNGAITFNKTGFSYVFPDDASIASNGYMRHLLIQTGASSSPTGYSTGNALNADGVAIQNGDPLYSAKIVETFYDPVTEQNTVTEHKLTLGVNTVLKLGSARSTRFQATVNDGYNITAASVNGVDIAFTDSSIDVAITDSQFTDPDDKTRAYLVTVEENKPAPVPVKTFINLYNPTVDQYNQLQKDVYASVDPTSTVSKPYEFISSAIELPFTIPSDVIGLQENLKAGQWSYGLMNRVLNPVFKVNLGKIKIEPKYNNALDFYNVKADFYFPARSGSVDLDPNMITGKTVSAEYIIVGTDGNVTLNIYADDLLISTTQHSIGIDVPFYSFYNAINKTYEPNSVNNNVLTPYIIITYPDYDGVISPTVEVKEVINGTFGYIEVAEIEIETIPYSDEYSLIQSLLRSGVNIKEVK